jgi:hypothetical protein
MAMSALQFQQGMAVLKTLPVQEKISALAAAP